MSRVTLSWPVKALRPNGGGKGGRGAIFARSKAAKIAKGEAHTLAYAAGLPTLPDAGPISVLWTLCPPDKCARDMDNAIAALKWHQDGVALAWGVNDARFVPTYQWADPVRGGCVHIEVLP